MNAETIIIHESVRRNRYDESNGWIVLLILAGLAAALAFATARIAPNLNIPHMEAPKK